MKDFTIPDNIEDLDVDQLRELLEQLIKWIEESANGISQAMEMLVILTGVGVLALFIIIGMFLTYIFFKNMR